MRLLVREPSRQGCCRGCADVLLHQLPGAESPDYWYGDEHGVYAVEHADVAGENGAGIFDSGAALDAFRLFSACG